MKELIINSIKKIASEEVIKILIDNLKYEDLKEIYNYIKKIN